MKRFCCLVALLALLEGCTVGPDYHESPPDLPGGFVAAPSPAAPVATKISADDEMHWWESFHDPVLSALVERAIAGNLDLKLALARLQEAETLEAVVVGAALPRVGVSGATGRGNGSDLTRDRLAPPLSAADNRNGAQVTQAIGFDAGWEIDLFGKFRREVEAASDDAQAAEEARNDTIVTLIADLVRAYFDQRGLQMRAAALDRSVATAQQTVDFVRQRYERGLTNELDLTLAERELAGLRAQVAPLHGQIDAARYSIAVLIGQYPEAVDRELISPAMIPTLPDSIGIGLPADLLRRRPDIREAERELAASTARIGVATADLFPRLDVTGAVGWQDLSTRVAEGPLIWGFGPAASWSLLDFGLLDALVDVQDLRTAEFLVVYKQTILRAVQQVDTAIGDYAAQQDSLRNLDTALAASQRSVTLATQRYDRGVTDFLNVLDAQRQEYQLEDQYAATQQAAADSLVALYKGLGGGWEKYQALPSFRQPQPAVIAAFRRLLDPEPAATVR